MKVESTNQIRPEEALKIREVDSGDDCVNLYPNVGGTITLHFTCEEEIEKLAKGLEKFRKKFARRKVEPETDFKL